MIERKGELKIVFSAFLELDDDSNYVESNNPTLFCIELESMKALWEIPKAIAFSQLDQELNPRVGILGGNKIISIDMMEWPEVTADSSDQVTLKKLESTKV